MQVLLETPRLPWWYCQVLCISQNSGQHQKPHRSHPLEAVDMEAAFARLEHDTHSSVAVKGESYYATLRRRLEETMKDINESCANRAQLAHELDSSLHSPENAY